MKHQQIFIPVSITLSFLAEKERSWPKKKKNSRNHPNINILKLSDHIKWISCVCLLKGELSARLKKEFHLCIRAKTYFNGWLGWADKGGIRIISTTTNSKEQNINQCTLNIRFKCFFYLFETATHVRNFPILEWPIVIARSAAATQMNWSGSNYGTPFIFNGLVLISQY